MDQLGAALELAGAGKGRGGGLKKLLVLLKQVRFLLRVPRLRAISLALL
ncbi:MAG: hypothetical protein WDZ84_00910 [Rhodovibrionaceae bacterium]